MGADEGRRLAEMLEGFRQLALARKQAAELAAKQAGPRGETDGARHVAEGQVGARGLGGKQGQPPVDGRVVGVAIGQAVEHLECWAVVAVLLHGNSQIDAGSQVGRVALVGLGQCCDGFGPARQSGQRASTSRQKLRE